MTGPSAAQRSAGRSWIWGEARNAAGEELGLEHLEALLGDTATAERVLAVLDRITATVRGATDRRSAEFVALRQALGYCWSVATVAAPQRGRALMEKWLADNDRDVRWIMRENLSKARLTRLDAAWVAEQRGRLD